MNFVWYDIKPDGTKYGLLVGSMMVRHNEPNPSKCWVMSLYDTERGRKMGIRQARREYPSSDILIFMINGSDFFGKAIPFFEVLKEKGLARGNAYEYDILAFIKSKKKRNN